MKTRQKIRRAVLMLSFILFPATFYYLSPVVSMMGAAQGIAAGSILVFAGLFITSLITGRLFCGWLCPAGALQECIIQVPGRKPPKYAHLFKYLIWAPWFGGILLLFRNAGGIKSVDFTYQTVGGLSVSNIHSLVMFLFVSLTIFVLALLFGKRGACHTVCWMAPFMVIGNKIARTLHIPRMGLKAGEGTCTSCGRCEKACPMSLPVTAMAWKNSMEHSDCILCGSCADECPKGTIRYSVLKRRDRNANQS